MAIKSDKWIRRMAEQHGMIDPFEPGQVREIDGRKIVSYGTSSYGYDIRCSNEFGGMMQKSFFTSTKEFGSKFLGSTMVELRFVNSLNSFEQRMS